MPDDTKPLAIAVSQWRDEPAPTHRCNVCGAMWRFWPRRDTGHEDAWNMRSNACGPCCDQAPMREQIQPLTIGQFAEWLGARLAVDTMTQQLFGPKDGDKVQ